jgi:transcriptional regulator with XRE-family HTH domain
LQSRLPNLDLTNCRVQFTLPFVPLDEGNLAQNVRRLAGMHLVSMETLARYLGLSRQSVMKMVASSPSRRSSPKASTALKIAEAFGVSLNALYQEPLDCLREAIDHFEEAPIRAVANVPTVDSVKEIAAEAGVPVVELRSGSRRRRKSS